MTMTTTSENPVTDDLRMSPSPSRTPLEDLLHRPCWMLLAAVESTRSPQDADSINTPSLIIKYIEHCTRTRQSAGERAWVDSMGTVSWLGLVR